MIYVFLIYVFLTFSPAIFSQLHNRDRLKQRQELLKLQKKAADSTNVSSAASVASSADNGVMSFEAFDDSQG